MTDLLRGLWDWFLLDTLVWTGALIALVLMLRRPVARYFGSGAAYALWFLPLARLMTPPMILPSWMNFGSIAPQVVEGSAVAASRADVPTIISADVGISETIASPIDFATPLVMIWLLGAMIFLVRRFWLYGALRKELLAEARPVGEVGNIRLIETSAISGPIAFGVLDKVIALPDGFIASHDRRARDLAIEHEVSHHRGHDLLVNVLVQPLFAVHWFNPLGWMGWNALRRDQEAACDARVVAARPQDERAIYASVIADFARHPNVAPRLALAAPMACPVLGDKSIIHRLRSLSMSDISPRRRFAGRAVLVTALFALPLTASVSYSQVTAPPKPPVAPNPPTAPEAPPVPPAPPIPDVELEQEFIDLERDFDEAERDFDRAEREMLEIERDIETNDSKRVVREKIRYNGKDWNEMTPEERKKVKKQIKETRQSFSENGELRKDMERLRRELGENGKMHRDIRIAVAEANAAGAMAQAHAPRVVMECRDGRDYVTTQEDTDGKMTMFVCEANAEKLAVNALRTARSAIATERNLSAQQRAEALRSIDEEIADLKK